MLINTIIHTLLNETSKTRISAEDSDQLLLTNKANSGLASIPHARMSAGPEGKYSLQSQMLTPIMSNSF